MRSRLWAAGTVAWVAAFIGLAYIIFDPAPWFVAMVAVAGLLALFAAVKGTEGPGRMALLVALIILVVSALLAGWKGGPVMLPAIISCILSIKSSAANLASPTPPRTR
ncbi:FtsH-binding integral membrane protein [Nakamurella sp. UYEF19]|uniref:hypothetical protein n=1 Tax=Nakamurella sp. UYEF19 TaxID=1756392 RepID=UPI003392F35F